MGDLGGEEVVTWDDLEYREGLYYQKFTDVPFTGKITGIAEGSFKNGKKEGPWVVYHKNGQLSSKGTFKNGWKEGHWVTYYDNGQLETKGDYKNVRFEGPWVVYHDNGQLMSKGTYKDGMKVK
mgnify:FL=1